MTHPHDESPFNTVSPVIVALALVLAGIEGAFSLGARGVIGGPEAVGWRLDALSRYAFSGEILRWMLDTGRFPPEHLIRFVAYPFVHASFTHALFSVVLLLALGKIVAEALGTAATLALFVLCAIGGAMVYAAIPGVTAPLVGAYPPVYGLIGAFTYLLWVRLGQLGAQQVRAFSLIGALLFIQLVFGVLFGTTPDWIADIGGFVTGFLLTMLLIPGGWSRLMRLIRRD